MRLRQLAYEQSVVFFAPLEVHQSIVSHSGMTEPDSAHVISWLMEQTTTEIERKQALFVTQGDSFYRRAAVKDQTLTPWSSESERSLLLSVVEEPEQSLLEDLYAPKTHLARTLPHSQTTHDRYTPGRQALDKVRTVVIARGAGYLAAAQEEQEKELELEVEEERILERPRKATARKHRLHDDVVAFVRSGLVAATATAYQHWTSAIRFKGNIAKCDIPASLGPQLYVSTDFRFAVEGDETTNEYQRPVQWILWSKLCQDTFMIISPYEAEHLHGLVRKSKHTHLLTYAAPVTRSMLKFDALDFYSIPPLPAGWKASNSIRNVLGLFAGRLYFKYKDYDQLCVYLGLEHPKADDGLRVMCKDPLDFLREWTSIRRKDADFSRTPTGFLLRSRKLPQDHAFFQGD